MGRYIRHRVCYSSVAWPLYLIEVEDNMEGSFTNITCIDEVHLDINSKVNEAMRDFISHIGKTACLNASDVTLELMSGNIRFKGAKVGTPALSAGYCNLAG